MSAAPSAARSDEQQIIDLTIEYCWALDTGEHHRLADIFLPDGVAVYSGQPFEGVAAIQAKVSSALGPLDASQHVVTNHQVRVEGDTARGRCYFQAQHVRRAAEGGPNWMVAGSYTDDYVRTEQGWRIRHRALEVLWTDGNPRVARP